MDHRQTEEFFAIVSPGLEPICASELNGLGMAAVQAGPGGVAFTGRLVDLYRANLAMRTATRILVRFATFRCRDFPRLFQQAVRLPWGRFIRADVSVELRVTCRGSRLNHTGRIAEVLSEAIDRTLGREAPPVGDRRQLILVRIINDQVQLSIDSSGDLLHRRGYRQATTAAPLRETLAAGILMLLDWDGAEPLYDPMCGAGTFLLEGGLIARHQAPGLMRSFAFMHWPGWREGLWRQLCTEARQAEQDLYAVIAGADRDPEAVSAAKANCRGLALPAPVEIVQRPLAEQPEHAGGGLLVCNPPYGQRLTPGDLKEFYAAIGNNLQRAFPGWRKALLCPDPALVEAMGLPFNNLKILDNGGLEVGLYVCAPG